MEISNYKHKIIEVVHFHEVDMLGVCNNAVYFSYFEDARIKYLQNLTENYGTKEIMEGRSTFLMAHNECDYIEPAYLDDELNIYTRIDFIKNSSFGFRHVVENNKLKKIIACGGGVFVYIDRIEKKSLPLPEEFYKAIQKHEPLVKILKK
jgi:acyl-CoA thioester hydrolase